MTSQGCGPNLIRLGGLIRRGRDLFLSLSTSTQRDGVGTQRDGGRLQAKREGLRMKAACQHLDPGFPASRTIRNVSFV